MIYFRESKAKELGLRPKAYLRSFTYASTDPFEELLLGPAYATPKLLDRLGMTLNGTLEHIFKEQSYFTSITTALQ